MDADAIFQRGLVLLAKGELEKAASDFTSAIFLLKEKTGKATAYRKRAEVYRAQGFPELATKDEHATKELEMQAK